MLPSAHTFKSSQSSPFQIHYGKTQSCVLNVLSDIIFIRLELRIGGRRSKLGKGAGSLLREYAESIGEQRGRKWLRGEHE